MFKKWHKWYTRGCKTVGLAPCGRQKKTVTVEIETNIITMTVAIDEDQHVPTRGLANLLNLLKSTIHQILRNELKMRRVYSTWLPQFFTGEQMQTRVNTCNENHFLYSKQPNRPHRVIASDETWVHYFNPLTNERARFRSERVSPEWGRCVNISLLMKWSSLISSDAKASFTNTSAHTNQIWIAIVTKLYPKLL